MRKDTIDLTFLVRKPGQAYFKTGLSEVPFTAGERETIRILIDADGERDHTLSTLIPNTLNFSYRMIDQHY